MYIICLMGSAVFVSTPSYSDSIKGCKQAKRKGRNKSWPVLPLPFNIICLRIHLIQSRGSEFLYMHHFHIFGLSQTVARYSDNLAWLWLSGLWVLFGGPFNNSYWEEPCSQVL